MTREEIQLEIEKVEGFISSNRLHEKSLNMRLTRLQKQLAELEVEVYEPIYLSQSGHNYAITENGKSGSALEKYLDRHNAGEELKKLISEENQKQGWKVDWETTQDKYYLRYYHDEPRLLVDGTIYLQSCENELYFSEQSSQDQDFLDKIKPLWLKSKGVE